MPAYLMIRIAADDPARLKEYQTAAPPVIAQYGGRFLARGGEVVTLEGAEERRRVVIIEFPCLADAQAFYHSPEYTAARALRAGVASAEIIAVDGVGP